MEIAAGFADTRTYIFPEPKPIQERRQHILPVHLFQIPYIQAHLIGEISEDLAISQPLQIIIEQDEDNTFIVSDDVFLVYGDGNNRSDAIKDYVTSLVEFYQILESNANLNPFDAAQFSKLQSFIRRRGSDGVQTDRI